MSRAEALDVLGLKPNASKQEIIDAHRKLISKLHPDRGGSDYLAAQINLAKKTLIND
jgi:curved DNA-binding protein CbpA